LGGLSRSHAVKYHFFGGASGDFFCIVDGVCGSGSAAIHVQLFMGEQGGIFRARRVEIFSDDNGLVQSHGSRAKGLQCPGCGGTLEGFASTGYVDTL
jgi:hypothetical protein